MVIIAVADCIPLHADCFGVQRHNVCNNIRVTSVRKNALPMVNRFVSQRRRVLVLRYLPEQKYHSIFFWDRMQVLELDFNATFLFS